MARLCLDLVFPKFPHHGDTLTGGLTRKRNLWGGPNGPHSALEPREIDCNEEPLLQLNSPGYTSEIFRFYSDQLFFICYGRVCFEGLGVECEEMWSPFED